MNLEMVEKLKDNNGITNTKSIFIVLGIILVIIVIIVVWGITKHNEERILNTISECVEDALNNRIVDLSSLGQEKEEISEIRYIKDDNTIITLIKTTTTTDQVIYAYKDTEIYGTDLTADISYEYADTEDDRVSIQRGKEIRNWWQEAQNIDIEKVMNK